MRGPAIALLSVAIVFSPALDAAEPPRFSLELEGGAAWQARNDFAVPGDGGTRVELGRFDSGPAAAFRGTLTWDVGSNWTVRAVVAPLSLTTDFVPETPVSFQTTTFPAGAPLSVAYRFNSYRLSAYHRFPASGPVSFRGGLTLKVRDARIGLEGSGLADEKANVGVVPLLYGGVRWQASPRVALDLEAEGLAAPQGRAGDVALKAEWALSERVAFFGGYRLLEGGADNEEVYNFATFHYLVGGARIRF